MVPPRLRTWLLRFHLKVTGLENVSGVVGAMRFRVWGVVEKAIGPYTIPVLDCVEQSVPQPELPLVV